MVSVIVPLIGSPVNVGHDRITYYYCFLFAILLIKSVQSLLFSSFVVCFFENKKIRSIVNKKYLQNKYNT